MQLMNPILVKEMRTRMRGKRAFVIVEAYVLTLGTIIGLVFWVMAQDSRMMMTSGAGLWLASIAIFVQTALICLISPTFTAAAISSEREQETFELVVQVNGRVRGRTEVPVGLSEDELIARARELPRVRAHVDDKELKNAIVVPGRLVNLVV